MFFHTICSFTEKYNKKRAAHTDFPYAGCTLHAQDEPKKTTAGA